LFIDAGFVFVIEQNYDFFGFEGVPKKNKVSASYDWSFIGDWGPKVGLMSMVILSKKGNISELRTSNIKMGKATSDSNPCLEASMTVY
jgi:hypothetical protein